jgi:serine/threonine-protein kinase
MSNIARAAGDRALACGSYRAARVQIAEMQRRGRLLGFVGAHRAKLDVNIAHCALGAPLPEMAAFRSF